MTFAFSLDTKLFFFSSLQVPKCNDLQKHSTQLSIKIDSWFTFTYCLHLHSLKHKTNKFYSVWVFFVSARWNNFSNKIKSHVDHNRIQETLFQFIFVLTNTKNKPKQPSYSIHSPNAQVEACGPRSHNREIVWYLVGFFYHISYIRTQNPLNLVETHFRQ